MTEGYELIFKEEGQQNMHPPLLIPLLRERDIYGDTYIQVGYLTTP